MDNIKHCYMWVLPWAHKMLGKVLKIRENVLRLLSDFEHFSKHFVHFGGHNSQSVTPSYQRELTIDTWR